MATYPNSAMTLLETLNELPRFRMGADHLYLHSQGEWVQAWRVDAMLPVLSHAECWSFCKQERDMVRSVAGEMMSFRELEHLARQKEKNMCNEGKLRVNVWQLDSLVVCQIVEQPEWVKQLGRVDLGGNFSFLTSSCPQLTPAKLYGRGAESKKDNNVVYYMCSSETEASELVRKITGVVTVVNSKAPQVKLTPFPVTIPGVKYTLAE